MQHTFDHAQRSLPGRTRELNVSMAQFVALWVNRVPVQAYSEAVPVRFTHARLLKSEV
jgi:hypothetical protein